MAGADLGGGGSAGPKKGKKQKKKRVAVRIDMTPMVDVVMLLITFFMLTTVFNTPQTMEINIPPEDQQVEVGESSLLTLRIAADGTIYWNMGIEIPKPVPFNELRSALSERLRMNPKLVTLIKVEREGTYSMLVDIIDELNVANISRFSLAPFKDFDKKLLAKAQAS